jgi:hypothetical protein
VTLATGEIIPNTAIDFGLYFQNSDGTPTGALAWSDLFNVVRDVAGVTKIDPGNLGFTLNGKRDDVPLSAVKFPTDGGLTFIDVETGDVL